MRHDEQDRCSFTTRYGYGRIENLPGPAKIHIRPAVWDAVRAIAIAWLIAG